MMFKAQENPSSNDDLPSPKQLMAIVWYLLRLPLTLACLFWYDLPCAVFLALFSSARFFIHAMMPTFRSFATYISSEISSFLFATLQPTFVHASSLLQENLLRLIAWLTYTTRDIFERARRSRRGKAITALQKTCHFSSRTSRRPFKVRINKFLKKKESKSSQMNDFGNSSRIDVMLRGEKAFFAENSLVYSEEFDGLTSELQSSSRTHTRGEDSVSNLSDDFLGDVVDTRSSLSDLIGKHKQLVVLETERFVGYEESLRRKEEQVCALFAKLAKSDQDNQAAKDELAALRRELDNSEATLTGLRSEIASLQRARDMSLGIAFSARGIRRGSLG